MIWLLLSDYKKQKVLWNLRFRSVKPKTIVQQFSFFSLAHVLKIKKVF